MLKEVIRRKMVRSCSVHFKFRSKITIIFHSFDLITISFADCCMLINFKHGLGYFYLALQGICPVSSLALYPNT